MKRIGSAIRKARSKLTQDKRDRGKLSIRERFKSFADGEKVTLKASPMVQNGRYPMRFHGLVGTVSGRQGESYKVNIRDGGKHKILIVAGVHLSKA